MNNVMLPYLVVQGLEVELFVLVAPHLVEVLLDVPPLLVLGLESPQHERHRHHGVPLQAVDNVGRLLAVDAPELGFLVNNDLLGKRSR